jgi:hypothetical protein
VTTRRAAQLFEESDAFDVLGPDASLELELEAEPDPEPELAPEPELEPEVALEAGLEAESPEPLEPGSEREDPLRESVL